VIDASWCVFLDRDGVINRRLAGDYVRSWQQFEFLSGALEGVVRLSQHAGWIVVVTNQAGVGKQLMSEADLAAVNARLCASVEESGGRIDAVFACTHTAEDRCGCRKPKPGLAEQAVERFPRIDFSRSVMIGDSAADIAFGHTLGMTTVLVGSDALAQELEPAARAPDLLAASRLLVPPLSRD
jgi:D-glycero-D-manno-heptose 1,7-bisphosphate phosphatase